jgi:phage host-nuclease inhibitor protein Gam
MATATKERKKAMAFKNISIDEASDCMAAYAKASARTAEINAKIDQAVIKIRQQYADEINELSEVMEQQFGQLQYYAENNPQLFKEKKSCDLAHGKLGFRTGTPKLKTLRGFTWASITELLKVHLPTFVRTVDEPAKDKLLAERENLEVTKLFGKVGIMVDQDESFYVEIKKEENPVV